MKIKRNAIRIVTMVLTILLFSACGSNVSEFEENREVSVGETKVALEQDVEIEPTDVPKNDTQVTVDEEMNKDETESETKREEKNDSKDEEEINGMTEINGIPEDVTEENEKFRVVISTDFPPLDTQYPFPDNTPNNHKSDPDDLQSMVRFLLYANEFEVEALIASAATFAGVANKQNIIDMIELYGKSYEKLVEFDPDYPTVSQLIEVTYQGNHSTWGKSVDHNIGEGKDTEASDAIIRIVDKEDERPVWFCVWGDCSNIAQAVYRVKQTRSQEELDKFVSKMRIYQIAHQDDTIDWLMENFPEMFIIYSEKNYMGVFRADNSEWVEKNIRSNHGELGAAYPKRGMGCEGVCEGDSPSFLYLLSARFGYSDAENPTEPSWGGQFKKLEGTNHYIDYNGSTSISVYKREFQQDFMKRLELIRED